MIRPINVEARPGYHIWVEYEDGVAGEIDLSDVAGRGVFAAWDEPGAFEKVYVSDHRSIAWSDDLEICPDAAYMKITGRSFEELVEAEETIAIDG